MREIFITAKFLVLLFSICNAQDHVTNITNDEGFHYYPLYIAEKNEVVYLKMTDSDYYVTGDLWSYNIDKDSTAILTTNTEHIKIYDNYLDWSAENNGLIFSTRSSIMMLDLDSNQIQQLVKGADESLDWIFGPKLNESEDKIAFWERRDDKNSHGINYLDIKNQRVFKVKDLLFNPGRGVSFYNPQWGNNDSTIVATFYTPEDNRTLYAMNIYKETEVQVDQNIYSSFIKIIENYVYYSKFDFTTKELGIFRYNLGNNVKQLVYRSVDINAVFDVDSIGNLYFSRNDSTFIFDMNKSTFIARGTNPSVINDKYLIIESWISKNELLNQLIMLNLSN